jgi:serine/threonine protein kinase/formylglycine-generating enzyme required for sulfatase activity
MADIPTVDWSWINAAAERFEQAWNNGERPGIEDFLINVPETQWPLLLHELMRVEGKLRRRAGEEPRAEEYRQRFPEHENVITAVFASALTEPTVAERAEPDGSTRATAESHPRASSLPFELANHPDYEIVRELGAGGMGVVYLARNRIMDRHEVLKVMGQQIVEQPGVRDRFVREIRAVAKLRHPNIVSAYSAFGCGRNLVFAMEYVEGLDLRRMVKAKGPMPIGHACYFMHQAALGLQHAHEEGMVHRDIKPGNLMLSHKKNRAVIKVLDFGLSKATSEQYASELGIGVPTLPMDFGAHLTCTGAMLGSPDFIAPEQIVDSQQADIRADIYSLGCTVYYLLSGHSPYPDLPLHDVLRAHRSLDARRLHDVRADVPAELSALVTRLMAKDPADRFQEPAEVAEALSPFFKKQSVSLGSTYLGASQAPAVTLTERTQPATGAVALAPAGAGGTEPGMNRSEPAWSSLIELKETEDDWEDAGALARPTKGRSGLGPRGWWAAAGVLLLGLLVAWAAVIVKIETKPGVIVLENLPENAIVEVDGDRVPVARTGGESIKIEGQAGKHVVVVKRGDDVLLGETVTLQSGKESKLTVRLDPPVAPQTVVSDTDLKPSRPQGSRPQVSGSVEVGTTSPTPPTTPVSTTGPVEGDEGKPLVPAAALAGDTTTRALQRKQDGAPHPFRVVTSGLGGARFIDPISFGPDRLESDQAGTAVPWSNQDAFARLTTKGGPLGYPRLPVSRYVFEVELTVNKVADVNLQLGDPSNACNLVFLWDTKRNMIECALRHSYHGLWLVSAPLEVAPGTRISLKLVVGDGSQALFQDDAPVLSAGGWPTDCCLRIWSGNPDSAVIHRCSLRPLTAQDVAACGWPIPPSRLPVNVRESGTRLRALSYGYRARPTDRKRFAIKTTGTPMAWIPPGEFEIGSRDPKDEARHRVRLTKGYWMAQTEVTQGEYSKVTGSNPSRVTGSPYLPVDWVAWDEAVAYCRKVTDMERQEGRLPAGYEYRLPTEAEWEYACRAGSEGDFSVPEEWVLGRDRAERRPHEIAESVPNRWGLYDMHGNAMEWCFDAWYEYPKGEKDVTVDPFNIGQPGKNTTFVVRGGAWWLPADACTSHWRGRNHKDPNGFRGFRIVLGPEIREPNRVNP